MARPRLDGRHPLRARGIPQHRPGSPPIGCILDYIAFLWVEPVIAFCVVTAVAAGVRAESAAEKESQESKNP